jgi:hypothetical protein
MTTETRLRKLERSLRLLTTKSLIRDTKYHIAYKGEILLTYDFNPADKIEAITQSNENLTRQIGELTQSLGKSQINLSNQERDNADLAKSIRTAQSQRDDNKVIARELETDLNKITKELDRANTKIMKLKSKNPLSGYTGLELVKIGIGRLIKPAKKKKHVNKHKHRKVG